MKLQELAIFNGSIDITPEKELTIIRTVDECGDYVTETEISYSKFENMSFDEFIEEISAELEQENYIIDKDFNIVEYDEGEPQIARLRKFAEKEEII